MILAGLFGNETAEKVLLFIENYGSGYPRAIASTFQIALTPVQRQLERLEKDGVLVSRMVGRTREYTLNPRYAFKEELSAVLRKALRILPQEILEAYFTKRARPRRKGKPL